MTTLERISQYAAEHGIIMVGFPSDAYLSVAIEDDEIRAIGINIEKLRTSAQKAVAAAHELGHHEMKALLSMDNPYMPTGKLEHRAWKWAISNYLPKAALHSSLQENQGRLWDVADDFGVTQAFVMRAIEYYSHDR